MDDVSIHAPRAGRDIPRRYRSVLTTRFNPRAPCGARPYIWRCVQIVLPFQSTRPVRGATAEGGAQRYRLPVSIHAPRAGRDRNSERDSQRYSVSIHAPRAGRDNI